jgi:opacity protein-like surface antigen
MKPLATLIALSLIASAAIAGDFTGWSAGVDIGAQQWKEKSTDQIITRATPAATTSKSFTNELLGVHAGFQMPVAAVVLGTEMHYSVLTGSASSTFGGEDFGYVLKPRWQAALDLRAGVVANGNLLYVITGPSLAGVARTYFDRTNFYGPSADDRIQKTTHGWSSGVGIERELSKRLNGRLEYRHSTYTRVTDYPSTFNHTQASPPDQFFESHSASADTLLFSLSYAL